MSIAQATRSAAAGTSAATATAPALGGECGACGYAIVTWPVKWLILNDTAAPQYRVWGLKDSAVCECLADGCL